MLICPLHELISVVALGPEISNELVALIACLLVQGDLFLKFWLDDPEARLFTSHLMHHEIKTGEGKPCLINRNAEDSHGTC